MNEIFTSPRTGLQYALVAHGKALAIVGTTNRDIQYIKVPSKARFSDDNIYPVVAVDCEAFKGMPNLLGVHCNHNLIAINSGAFRDCPQLEAVYLKSSRRRLVELGDYAFSGCTSLKHVWASFKVDPYEGAECAFQGCESLESIDYIKVYDGPEGDGGGIPVCLFSGCKSLKQITIDGPVLPGCRRPSKPTYGWGYVGDFAFSGCENLERIDGTFKMQTIGIDAFKGCNKLNPKPVGLTAPTRQQNQDLDQWAKDLASYPDPVIPEDDEIGCIAWVKGEDPDWFDIDAEEK